MNVDTARDVLGLAADADEKTVRRAYAKLAKTYRPDTHPDEFSNIRKAYDTLLNALRNNDYQDPDLPSAPDPVTTDDQVHLPTRRAVSYVMDESAYNAGLSVDSTGHDDVQSESGRQQSYRTEVEANPLQSIEDSLVDAIKAVKPGQLESENKVVLLVDEYLLASNSQSRKLREYVERFLVGVCLGDYYVPHAVRERVADFSGLSNVVVSTDRLQSWEREFLARFDESELVEVLLTDAASKTNTAERGLIHGISWSKAFMLRLDVNKTLLVNRWMNWSDEVYGEDGGLINAEFRAKWRRLRQVEPLTPSLLILFIALMIASGLVLNALGVPLQDFFQLPVSAMLQTAAGLAVLSWANFVLVQLARPVIRNYVERIRTWLYINVPIPILAVESVALVTLIWAWALDGVSPNEISSTLVVVSGCVLVVVGVFSRQWSWVSQLTFPSIVVRLFTYFVVSVALLDEFVHSEAAVTSLWLVLGLVVWVCPPRALFQWVENSEGKPFSLISLRHTKITLSTLYPRLFIACVALLCLVVSAVSYFVEAPSALGGLMLGVLSTVLALELAMNGGVHSDGERGVLRYGVVFGLVAIVWFGRRIDQFPATDFIVQTAACLYLLWSAAYWMAPRTQSRIQGQ